MKLSELLSVLTGISSRAKGNSAQLVTLRDAITALKANANTSPEVDAALSELTAAVDANATAIAELITLVTAP